MSEYAAGYYIPLKTAPGIQQSPGRDGVPDIEVPSDIVATTILCELSSVGSTML